MLLKEKNQECVKPFLVSDERAVTRPGKHTEMGAFHPHDCAPWSDDLDIGRAADLGRAAVHAEPST